MPDKCFKEHSPSALSLEGSLTVSELDDWAEELERIVLLYRGQTRECKELNEQRK